MGNVEGHTPGYFLHGVKERGPVWAHILLSLACGLWALAAAFLS